MGRMQASIIITTFRRTAMLRELLAVLGSQIEGRFVEALVIDNCPDASARESVQRTGNSSVRYIHEPKSGVVHARNRGVDEAAGEYLIFLDDDEVPCTTWLDAWLAQADGSVTMAFGRIVPRLLAPCPPSLKGQVDRAYSRDMHRPTGADISDLWAYLGTGNAMFHKTRCFSNDTSFDHRFNARGGEDVWLIRSLVRNGHRLLWNHDALVDELVPENRMTLPFAKARKFNQGQLRCILMYGDGGIGGIARVSLWMVAGAIQFTGYSLAAALMELFAPERAPDFACRAAGGVGKLLWWRAPELNEYSQT